jgi:hypothetical protein
LKDSVGVLSLLTRLSQAVLSVLQRVISVSWRQDRLRRFQRLMPSSTHWVLEEGMPRTYTSLASYHYLYLSYHLPNIPGSQVGLGSKTKAVNQLLAGIHLCAAAEAMAFAKLKGMDLESVFDVVSRGAAASYMLSDRMSISRPRVFTC